jgi:hypothetical protein
MIQFARARFPHRHNPDGTFDSICAGCFQTLATARIEAELAEVENAHNCRGFNVYEAFNAPKHGRRCSQQAAPGESQGI